MKNKRGLIVFLILIIAFSTFLIILSASSCNDPTIEIFHAEITIDKNGDITVDEKIVTTFRGYIWDVKTDKNHYNNPLFNPI